VEVTNSCGTSRDEILIKDGTCDIIFPTAFTPNNDGKNELFRALGPVNVAEFRLSVYNRWGEKIFETNDYTKGWAGDYKGKLQDAGTYSWYCRFKRIDSIESIVKKGTVTLIK
jgi:gliding motility-associated-like protein